MPLSTNVKQKNPYEKLVDDIMMLPRGPKRWRAAVNTWLLFNQPNDETGILAQQENKLTIKDNVLERELAINNYGTSNRQNATDALTRRAMRFPEGAVHYIELIDPQAFTKENMGKMFNEFPEYRVAEKH